MRLIAENEISFKKVGSSYQTLAAILSMSWLELYNVTVDRKNKINKFINEYPLKSNWGSKWSY